MSMSPERPPEADSLAPYRPRLLGLAYRMLGSRSDADDVLQDAWLRFAEAQDVRNPEAFLVTVVTRLCLDRLKSAQARREVYVGPWLPEPIVDADAIMLSDGGGRKLAALNPIHGAEKIARFFTGIMRKRGNQNLDIRIEPATINGSFGALLYLDGELDQTISLAIDGDKIAAIYLV